jgi:hypothetical protein
VQAVRADRSLTHILDNVNKHDTDLKPMAEMRPLSIAGAERVFGKLGVARFGSAAIAHAAHRRPARAKAAVRMILARHPAPVQKSAASGRAERVE